MIVSVPAAEGVVASWATPSVSVTVPSVVDPSAKVTVPVGTPVPGLTTLTVALERHRLAEDRRDGQRRHDDLGGGLLLVVSPVTVMGVVVWAAAMELSVTVKV